MSNSQSYRPVPDGMVAVEKEKRTRIDAADKLAGRSAVTVASNGEERIYHDAPISNFTKGLRQDVYGIPSDADYIGFVAELSAPTAPGDPHGFMPDMQPPETLIFQYYDADKGAFADPERRRYESPLGGLNSDMIGPAIAGVGMPAAPPLGSSELCAEMAELYAMALMRDLSFAELQNPAHAFQIGNTTVTVKQVLDELNKLNWFDGPDDPVSFDPGATTSRPLNAAEQRRHTANGGALTAARLFRGSTDGARRGPYLSQFMVQGTKGDQYGNIKFGSQTISQKSQPDADTLEYMTNWAEWLDVQRGGKRGAGKTGGAPRFLTTLRDMAAYVHVDQLYQAYFNAALLILGAGDEPGFDSGMPSNNKDMARTGFATWGGPHLLDMLARVSSPALRAVRRQKFQIHRRARPEVLAARITMAANNNDAELGAAAPRVQSMLAELKRTKLLDWVHALNTANNKLTLKQRGLKGTVPAEVPNMAHLYLLPMAFPEGSPMHPAYGAGHATVAGACVTVLKAMLNTVDGDDVAVPMSVANLGTNLEANDDRTADKAAISGNTDVLTITGELDKLAANISIGRNMAGVHFYTDYYESLRMGERIAVAMLEEHLLCSPEAMDMRFFDYDGRLIRIVAQTQHDPVRPDQINTTSHIEIDGVSDPQTVAAWWQNTLPV